MGEVARGLIRCSARHCSFRRRRCNEPLPWRFPAAGGWARCCKAGCRLGLAIGPAAPTRVPAHECARRKRRLSPVRALGFAGKVGSTPRYGNCARSTGYCKDCRASGARAGARPACACGARSARRAGGNHRLAGTDHGRHRLCLASPQEIKQAGRTMPAARSRSTVAKNESICFRRSMASRSSVQIRADVGAAVQRTPCSIRGSGFAGGALQARLFCQRRQTREQRPENQPPRVLGDHEQQVKQAAFPASGANAPGSLCRAVAAG